MLPLKNRVKPVHSTWSMRNFFAEFCENSSIHGIRYLTERKRHWSERFWWMIAFIVSVCLCSSSIRVIWMKWCNNPISMRFIDTDVPISAIPFPTVVICPVTKNYKHKINVTSVYHTLKDKSRNLTNIEQTRFEALIHICSKSYPDFVKKQSKFTNDSIYDIIKDIAPTSNDTLSECKWKRKKFPCSQLLAPALTENGVCFAFNALNSHEMYKKDMAPGMMTINTNPNVTHWSLEHGYNSNANDQSYPNRIFNARKASSLHVTLRLFKRDFEYFCSSSGVQGYKIFITSPGEELIVSRNNLRLTVLEKVRVVIKPTLTTTTKVLRSYEPSKRQCFTDSERQLRFYHNYTQINCRAECLSNFTEIECGCVKFSMPREIRTKICGAGSLPCYEAAEEKLYGEDLIDGLQDRTAKSFREKCNCLPACTAITYDIKIDKTDYDWEAMLNAKGDKNQSDIQPSFLSVYFSKSRVETLQRSALYTYTDFMAICGGLLGLFLGGSVLSIIEFIYYSTLRLYWTIRRWKAENVVVPINRKVIKTTFIDIEKK